MEKRVRTVLSSVNGYRCKSISKRAGSFFSSLALALGLLSSMASGAEDRFESIEPVREMLLVALRNDPAFDAVEADQSEPADIHVRAGDVSVTVNVMNLFNYLNAYPEENADEAISGWVGAVNDAIHGASQIESSTNTDASLIVVLRSREYLDSLVEAGAEQPLNSPLIGPIYLTYMLDAPDAILAFTEESRNQRNNDELFEIAKKNVRPWLQNVVEEKLTEGGSAFFVDGNTFLSPSLILLDEFWDSISADFPGDVIIAIPRKDQLFLYRADSPKAMARARGMVEVTFEEDFNLLTDVLLIRRDGKIQQLEE